MIFLELKMTLNPYKWIGWILWYDLFRLFNNNIAEFTPLYRYDFKNWYFYKIDD